MNIALCLENTSAKMALLIASGCRTPKHASATRVMAESRDPAKSACCLQPVLPYWTLDYSSNCLAFPVYVGVLALTTQNLKVLKQFAVLHLRSVIAQSCASGSSDHDAGGSGSSGKGPLHCELENFAQKVSPWKMPSYFEKRNHTSRPSH